jgi:hypothetical protein
VSCVKAKPTVHDLCDVPGPAFAAWIHDMAQKWTDGVGRIGRPLNLPKYTLTQWHDWPGEIPGEIPGEEM